MKWFDVTLKVQSALGTLLSADTLFGHLCWSIRYRDGEKALGDFLAAYGADVPLLLSDPCPVGFWQMPILPRPRPQEENHLLKIIQSTDKTVLEKNLSDCKPAQRITGLRPTFVEAFDILKWLYTLRWLPEEALNSTINGLSSAAILNWFLEKGCGQPNIPKETVVPHNTINRLTGATGDQGSFFFTREHHIDPGDPPVFHLVAGSDCYTAEQISDLLTGALAAGYGKFKSRGKGHVTVESVKPIILPTAQNPNAVMLLAACAPTANDPTDGFWKLATKHGKLGGHWAVGPHPSGKHNPYKRPLMMLAAGTILKTDAPRPCYGRLVENIHPDFAEVRHYGLSPAIPVCCDFSEDL
ncbi:MAG TPA: hypothetical protein ENN97_07560 [Phycisphaerales bacterium]|nr:hypothetical protein [Phycisphaerales bacterium]